MKRTQTKCGTLGAAEQGPRLRQFDAGQPHRVAKRMRRLPARDIVAPRSLLALRPVPLA